MGDAFDRSRGIHFASARASANEKKKGVHMGRFSYISRYDAIKKARLKYAEKGFHRIAFTV